MPPAGWTRPTRTVTCDNPLCGDRVTVDLQLDQGQVTEIGQHTRGCLLTQAAASVVGRHAAGGSAEEVGAVILELRPSAGRRGGRAPLGGARHVRAGERGQEPPRMRAAAVAGACEALSKGRGS